MCARAFSFRARRALYTIPRSGVLLPRARSVPSRARRSCVRSRPLLCVLRSCACASRHASAPPSDTRTPGRASRPAAPDPPRACPYFARDRTHESAHVHTWRAPEGAIRSPRRPREAQPRTIACVHARISSGCTRARWEWLACVRRTIPRSSCIASDARMHAIRVRSLDSTAIALRARPLSCAMTRPEFRDSPPSTCDFGFLGCAPAANGAGCSSWPRRVATNRAGTGCWWIRRTRPRCLTTEQINSRAIPRSDCAPRTSAAAGETRAFVPLRGVHGGAKTVRPQKRGEARNRREQ